MNLRDVRPLSLRSLIAEFCSWNAPLGDKDYAEGRCWDTSRDFVNEVLLSKVKGDIRIVRVDKLPDYAKYRDQHWLAWVNGLHIDLTARQFHHAFAFPRLWRGSRGCVMKEYSAKEKHNIGIDAHLSAWQYFRT
jgi:hypothetical protein